MGRGERGEPCDHLHPTDAHHRLGRVALGPHLDHRPVRRHLEPAITAAPSDRDAVQLPAGTITGSPASSAATTRARAAVTSGASAAGPAQSAALDPRPRRLPSTGSPPYPPPSPPGHTPTDELGLVEVVSPNAARCGFCGKESANVQHLVATGAQPRPNPKKSKHASISICNECLNLCDEIFDHGAR